MAGWCTSTPFGVKFVILQISTWKKSLLYRSRSLLIQHLNSKTHPSEKKYSKGSHASHRERRNVICQDGSEVMWWCSSSNGRRSCPNHLQRWEYLLLTWFPASFWCNASDPPNLFLLSSVSQTLCYTTSDWICLETPKQCIQTLHTCSLRIIRGPLEQPQANFDTLARLSIEPWTWLEYKQDSIYLPCATWMRTWIPVLSAGVQVLRFALQLMSDRGRYIYRVIVSHAAIVVTVLISRNLTTPKDGLISCNGVLQVFARLTVLTCFVLWIWLFLWWGFMVVNERRMDWRVEVSNQK